MVLDRTIAHNMPFGDLWKLANRNEVAAILLALSKAFDILEDDLLIAYGFSREALMFIYCYFTERKQV